MRLATIAAAVLAATLALPAGAGAQSAGSLLWEQATRPGVSSGFELAIEVPGELRQKPMAGVTIKFAPGSRIDADGAPLCTAPREQRVNEGHRAACPAGSEVGVGDATALAGSGTVDADLSFWNVRAPDRDLLNVEQLVNGQRVPPFSGTLGSGSIEFVFASAQRIARITATVRRNTETVGGEPVAYFRTPPVCTYSRRWKIRARLNFEDKTTRMLRAQVPCRRPR
ncbi:MAG TPA: hypothetical protein VF517_10460 [Thermoleophilaceae bacterium]|jgi:hypothetical protein